LSYVWNALREPINLIERLAGKPVDAQLVTDAGFEGRKRACDRRPFGPSADKLSMRSTKFPEI
jgi:hypothetical protein